MAWMNQERKRSLEPAVKAVLKKYGVKGRLSVRHRSTLVLKISSGKLNFAKDVNGEFRNGYTTVNTYHIDNHWNGESKAFLNEVKRAMMVGNHDNSDITTDYFDVGWYIDINVGDWKTPYMMES